MLYSCFLLIIFIIMFDLILCSYINENFYYDLTFQEQTINSLPLGSYIVYYRLFKNGFL